MRRRRGARRPEGRPASNVCRRPPPAGGPIDERTGVPHRANRSPWRAMPPGRSSAPPGPLVDPPRPGEVIRVVWTARGRTAGTNSTCGSPDPAPAAVTGPGQPPVPLPLRLTRVSRRVCQGERDGQLRRLGVTLNGARRPSAQQLYDGHRDAPGGQERRPGSAPNVCRSTPRSRGRPSPRPRPGRPGGTSATRPWTGWLPRLRGTTARRKRRPAAPRRVMCRIAACTGHSGCRVPPQAHLKDRRVSVLSPPVAVL